MKNRATSYVMTCILAAILIHSTATAQWIDQVGAMLGDLEQQGEPDFIADGEGGVIVVFSTAVNGSSDIYIQRYDDHGIPQWYDGGLGGPVICNGTWAQTDPRIAEDGNGGAFITWQDDQSGSADVYGQRIDATGSTQWTANGIPIASGTATQANHEIAYDGYGGLIVVWDSFHVLFQSIRAQRVGADGTLLWGSGVTVGSTIGGMRNPELVVLPGATEADTRVTVVWEDTRDFAVNGTDLYAQRLRLDGTIEWALSGAMIYADLGDQLYPDLIASDASSTIICWRDLREYEDRGYCQKLNRFGGRMWTSAGISLGSMNINDVEGPKIASDAADGAFVTCSDLVLRLDPDGNSLWANWTKTVTLEPPYNAYPVCLDDGDCVVVYHQHPSDTDPKSILANRFDRDTGEGLWRDYGVPLVTIAHSGFPFRVLCSGDGVFAVWDWAYWAWFVSVQRLDVDEGYWGYPRPVITAIEDLPQDEGGWLTLNVRATSNDQQHVSAEMATGYNIWRRIELEAGAKSTPAEAVLAAIGAGEKTSGLRVTDPIAVALGLPAGDWESLGFHAAMQEPYYDFVVPTRTDAVDGSEPYEVLAVTVHTTSPAVHFASLSDSAFSVDNLAPGLLQGLAGDAIYDPLGLDLSWQALETSDLAHYAIHRGADETFIPDQSNLVATPTQTAWLDDEWTMAAGFYYKAAGVDRHGNVGAFAALSPDDMSNIFSDVLPIKTSLAQNRPNPFNPRTTIAFELPEREAVSLRVFDVAGHLVRVLVDGEVYGQGCHEAVWDGRGDGGRQLASGTYSYRLEAGEFTETKRMVLLK